MITKYRLGTIGYSNPDWQGSFYPSGLGQSKWLPFYATQFDSLELNTTFHAAQPPERFERWSSQVGPNFQFAVKTPRAITHDQSLKFAVDPMMQFIEAASALESKLGPILIQLPPECSIDSFDYLDRLLGALPVDLKYAVEFRNDTWVNDRTTDLLRRHNAAWVGLDHIDHPHLRRLRATSDFLYVRLVGRHGRYVKTGRELRDPTQDLKRWHTAIHRELDHSHGKINEVWVLASNDYAGHSPATLRRFASIAGISIASSPVQSELFAG